MTISDTIFKKNRPGHDGGMKERFMHFLFMSGYRPRYFLTRNNRLRLRYRLSAFAALSCLLAGVAGASFSPHIEDSYTHVSPASVNTGHEQADISIEGQLGPNIDPFVQQANLTAQRLQRYKGSPNQKTVQDTESRHEPEIHTPQIRSITEEVGSGDTLSGILEKAGLSGGDAYRTILSLEDVFDPRDIRPGHELRIDMLAVKEEGQEKIQLQKLELAIGPIRSVVLQRDETDETLTAELQEKTVTPVIRTGKAEIEISLYGSGAKAGLSSNLLGEVIRIYSWDVDFQRDIRQGDQLEVMYEELRTEDGTVVGLGDVLFAALRVNGQDIPVYRFEMPDGAVDYFTPDGHSIRKALMKTPVEGARLSSGYGMRKHPVLGYNKMHKGLDFAAPTGTPIYAAGDGTIEKLGPWSSYGNYVRIRHNSTLKTAYAHLHKFANGLSAGSRVKQGQIIGYVGSTGRSTGPHLHYEVMINGKQVNPSTVDLPQGESLKGELLTAFQRQVKTMDRQYAAISREERFAALDR